MTLLLRGSLSLLFVGIAALIFMFPQDSEVYVAIRYAGLKRFMAYNFPSIPMPKKLFGNAPALFMQGTAAILFIGALCILLNRRFAIAVYAHLVLLIGGLLHIPYDRPSLVPQVRKLIFVFATFFGLLTLAARSESRRAVRREKKEEEVKTEEKAKAE